MYAGTNWREIRGRLILAGIPDPLRQLPDMHALLDVTEVLITQHMTQEQLDRYNNSMYRPETTAEGTLVAAPRGFEPDEQLSAFDAAMAALGE
ncbi:DUF7240 domain-containing protein [Nocardia wallacei]|uniref:Uncharacterized protein n=1 Tax=Nocardia wallacei TaxID=480035 RepID=A0A7G1KT49_9NOCA|nr:hypothetical protein [Nocardia wallacei]BCK58387.1 hypothetical protein NWFMUON74_61590 [Nocardia wallacei]